MFNWFSKQDKKIDLSNNDNLMKFIEDSLEGLISRIKSSEHLYDFIIEDLCGAAQGNDVAKAYVRYTGFHPVEYEHALGNNSTMDEDDSALDYMNNTVSAQLMDSFGLEGAIEIRCLILNDFLQKNKEGLAQIRLNVANHKLATSKTRHVSRRNENEWLAVIHSLGGSIPSEKPKLKAQSVLNIVPRISYTDNGVFFDLYKDIEGFFQTRKAAPIESLMPIFYASRYSYAGLFAQGLVTKEMFDKIDATFSQAAIQAGQSLSRDEEIEFQEDSLDKAIEWINLNYQKVERHTTHLLVASAKQGLSLRDVLNSAVDTWETDDFSDNLDLEFLTPEFCSMFYSMGGWLPNENYQILAEKSYAFLYHPLLQPSRLLSKNRIK